MRKINEQNPDNMPDLEDYLEAHGTVFITVELTHATFANSYVRHLEVMNRPPAFEFEDHDQVCFVANINGGDSRQFTTRQALMYYLNQEFINWLNEGVMKGNDEERWTSIER